MAMYYSSEPAESPDRSSLTDPLLPSSSSEHEFGEDPLLLDCAEEAPRRTRSTTPDGDHRPSSLQNVSRILALTWFGFTGKAIWSQSVLSILVYLLHPDHPERVGYAAAVMGISQVASSILADCLSRVGRRHHVLRFASIVGMGAIGLTVYATLIRGDFYWLLGGLSAWGAMWGITDAALPSLFANSIPEGSQNLYYTRGSRVIRSSNALGPLAVLGLFVYLGNEWTIYNCSIVMTVGLGFCVPMVLLLCCLRETEGAASLPDEIDLSETHLEDEDCKYDSQNNSGITESTSAVSGIMDDSVEEEDEEEFQSPKVCCCCKQSTIVPFLISVAEVLSGIASGASLRYFPVFLVSNLHLSPIHVQLLFMITPLGQAAFKCVSKTLAKYMGAISVTIILQWIFVAVLGSMLYFYERGLSAWIVCTLYLGQAFLMNSTSALTQSIVISTLPDERARRWAGTETLQLLLWSLSAGAGGYMAGKFGVLCCFYATAGLQLLATLPLLLLCCVGPSREEVNYFLFPSGFDRDYTNEDEEHFDWSLPLGQGDPHFDPDDGDCTAEIGDQSDATEYYECHSLPGTHEQEAACDGKV